MLNKLLLEKRPNEIIKFELKPSHLETSPLLGKYVIIVGRYIVRIRLSASVLCQYGPNVFCIEPEEAIFHVGHSYLRTLT